MKKKLLALALLLAGVLAAPPAWADKTIVLEPSAAHTANGNSATDYDSTGFTTAQVFVNVTAGSGTVNPFKVFLAGTQDLGTTYYAIPCTLVAKDVAGPGGTVTITAAPGHTLIVNETAVVSSATQYAATCPVTAPRVRAQWVIAGTTPSETFSVTVNLKP